MSKPALGRGLGALLGSGRAAAGPATPSSAPSPAADAAPPAAAEPPARAVRNVALDKVVPSPLQPRREFTEDALRDLAESIRSQGILQPLVVRPGQSGLELIAGERRWRAARLAGLKEVPVLEREATDREVLELALVENLQRENLNPLEEALGYSELQSRFGLTQDHVAQKVGRSRAAVANALRLLKLPDDVKDALKAGQLSVGHAKVLLGIADAALLSSVARQAREQSLSVRQTEEVVSRLLAKRDGQPAAMAVPPSAPVRDPHVVDVENRLRQRLATRVGVRYRAGRGSIEIRFADDDELSRILALLGVEID